MKTRKLVLIIADIILLAILIAQCVFLSRDSGKTFKLKETPDEILIQKGEEKVVLAFENNQWVVGENKYPTNMSVVDSILDSLTVIRCIDKAGSVTKPGALEKYELTDDKKISVTALKEGTALRSIEIGKEGITGTQNFITVDGGKDIYLATGGLRYDFDTSEDQLRSTIVWDLDETQINTVEVEKLENVTSTMNLASDSEEEWNSGETFKISKTGSGEALQWNVTGADGEALDIDLDTEKAQSWFDSLGSLTTSMWYDESENLEKELGSTKIATTKITHGNSTATIDIYQIPAGTTAKTSTETDSGEEGENSPKYYGKSSETPYPFELTLYTMEKINKNPEELAK